MKTLVLYIKERFKINDSLIPNVCLYHPNGNLMVTESIRGVNPEQFDRIILVSLKKNFYLPNYEDDLIDEITKTYNIEPEFLKIDREADTLSSLLKLCINRCKIEGFVFIKNSEDLYTLESTNFEGSGFIVTDIINNDINLDNKYFMNKELTGVAESLESQYVSNSIYFEDANRYSGQTRESKTDLNHILRNYTKINHIKTKKYYDLSTLKLWRKYQERFKTIFIDLDGILFKHKEKRFTKKWFYDEYPINTNINKLKEIYSTETCYIVIMTARPEQQTIELLKQYNVPYHRIIADLPLSAKMMIGVFDLYHYNPNITSINLPKDVGNLRWTMNL